MIRRAAKVDAVTHPRGKWPRTGQKRIGHEADKCQGCAAPSPPDAKGRPRRFCSRACVGRAVGLQGALRIRNPPKPVVCETCSHSFTTFHRQRRFCSSECYWVHRRRNPINPGGGNADKNQPAIIKAFESMGAKVARLDMVGGGVPDLLIGFRGGNYLVEVKNPETQYGRAGFNKNQKQFLERWPGDVPIVRTLDDVVALVAKWSKQTDEQALAAVGAVDA